MLNLDKLNTQVDLKSINVDEILKQLKDNQKVIMLVFGAITLILAGMMFKANHIKVQGIASKIASEQEKLGLIKARDAAIADLNNFKSQTSNEIGQVDLIAQISDYATQNHVEIATLKPPESAEMGLYSSNNFSFTAVADNFKNLMLFLRSIEKSKSGLRFNSWSGGENTEGKLLSDIQLSAVHIHS